MHRPGFKKLLLLPSFTGKDAKAYGIDPHVLPYYVKTGVLERVARGVYRNPNVFTDAPFEIQDLLETAQSIPEGTICGVSALNYYGLTLEIPRQFWIVGTKLYESLFERLKEERLHLAVVGIALPNEPSVQFHKKLGFEEVGVFKEYAKVNGQYFSSIWMQKRLG